MSFFLFRPLRGDKVYTGVLKLFARGEWAFVIVGRSAHPMEHYHVPDVDDGLRLWFKWENFVVCQRWLRGMRRREQHCKNLERRPPCLRDPIPPDILNAAPVEPLVLDAEDFARNMRSAKRGAQGARLE